MSNLIPSPHADLCTPFPESAPALEALPSRAVHLGDLPVQRVLPVRNRRLIGPWCFFDRYGPLTFTNQKPMDVAPHPHTGLQTLSWLFSGEIVHKDSLASECLIRPGQLSLMTAGRGIAHAEETPAQNSGSLDGIQLWIALPNAARHIQPHYQCTPNLPSQELPNARLTTILGPPSPGAQYSPALAAEVKLDPHSTTPIELTPTFEHGLMLIQGEASIQQTNLEPGTLYHLAPGPSELPLTTTTGARLILLGGPPFPEPILMWWNFVARTPEELTQARASWQDPESALQQFGAVPHYQGPRLTAPELLGRPLSSTGGQHS